MAATCAGCGDSEGKLGRWLSEASCCLFKRIWEAVKPEPRPAIQMEKQLGGTESLGISKVGQTVLVRLMESQICHQLAVSVALWGKG